MPEFTRRVMFFPAWDKQTNYNGNVHGVNMAFVLNGPLGAVAFIIWTNWHTPQVQEQMVEKFGADRMARYTLHPYPVDVGLHWTTRLFGSDETYDHEGCDFLEDGQFCFYDGSGLAATELFAKLVEFGDEAVWAELEAWYRDRDDTGSPEEFAQAKTDVAELRAELERPLES